MEELISIIVPVYNGQAFIGETIQSVQSQTYQHWEMLIVDDGSTDDTRQVIETYLGDRRIRYLYQTNRERAAARNYGLKVAQGKYIAFLDADDLWLPDKLKTQVAYLEAHPEIGLCFTRCWLIDNQTNCHGMPTINFIPGPDQFERLLFGNFITNSSVVMPQCVFDRVGFFDETLPVFGCEDWDMWLRIARFYPIHLIDHPLALYRLHESNTSLERMRLSAEAVLQKVFTGPTLPSYIVKNKKMVYTSLYLNFCETSLRLNQRQRAFEYWQRAWQVYPQGLFSLKRGWWATLKLSLPYSVISNLPKLRSLLKTKEASFNSNQGR
ncbi:MAG: glycosyltransferase [Anaerolineae bacterium]|nr:glycosyltransferase [Anaerolineae bacterium]